MGLFEKLKCFFQPTTEVQIRGRLEDVLNTIQPNRPAGPPRPPLPKFLPIQSLPQHKGGCPGCGTRSIYGENIWTYDEIDRCRERGDNTTSYIGRCQKCLALFRVTWDHEQ